MLRRRTGLLVASALVFSSAAALSTGQAQATTALCATTPPPAPAVVIGSPGEDVGRVMNAGAIHLALIDENGDVAPAQMITESTLGVTAGSGDRFGATSLIAFDEDYCPVVVVGAPGWNSGRGRVFVIKLTPTGPSTTELRQGVMVGGAKVGGSAEAGDGFGSALAWGYATDGRAWLAVGVPGEDIGTGSGALKDAGIVQIFDTAGADAWGASDYTINQDTGDVSGAAENGDRFGSALSLAPDGLGLAVGAPGESIGSLSGAGGVNLIGAADGEFPLNGEQRGISQGQAAVPGTPEAGDRFGASLAVGDVGAEGFLAIGVPGEDIGSVSNAGTVIVAYPNGTYGGLTQGSSQVNGGAEKGDQFGSVLAAAGFHLLVGVPSEDVGPTANAGLVHTFTRGSTYPYRFSGATDFTTTEKSAGILGTAQAKERFGAAVAWGGGTVWVGAPGERVSGQAKAGLAYRLSLTAASLDYVARISQQTTGWGGDPEPGDGFGGGIGAATFEVT